MNRQLRSASIGLLLASCALSFPAAAIEFDWGAIEGSFNSQLSLGSSWRMSDPDAQLVTPGNAPGFGLASTGTGDDGNLNFEDGDIYSLILKGVHDLELRKGDFGLFARAKYWYDFELKSGDRPHGTSFNLYTPDQRLLDGTYDSFAKSSGFELLDAFVYGSFYLGENGIPLDLRVGRQVASWGESTFIQNGINVINPIDVSAFRRPGAEIKEGLLPVNMVTVSMGLTDALSFDAFYQLEWEKTVIDACGTYFSTADVAATGCNMVTLTNQVSDRNNVFGFQHPVTGEFIVFPGTFITRTSDIEPDDEGQFGLSFRYFAEQLAGSEFGIYYMNYHSRIPYLGGVTSANELINPALPAFVPSGAVPFDPLNPQYFAEFPEDIELWGLSFATNFAGFAISGEVSHRPDFPVQINTVELLHAAVLEAPWSTLYPAVVAADPGEAVSGYDELPVTQAQVTFIRFFDQVLGASRLSFAAEIGANWVDDLPDQSVQRYGRSSIFGMGEFNPLPVAEGVFVTCEQGFDPAGIPDPNSNERNCTKDGYVTDSSWGYRIRASLTYNDVFAGVNLTPRFAWSHDVDGYSPNSNFTEDATALSVGLTAEYLNRYTASLDYTTFSSGDYSTIKDRDFMSLSVSVSF